MPIKPLTTTATTKLLQPLKKPAGLYTYFHEKTPIDGLFFEKTKPILPSPRPTPLTGNRFFNPWKNFDPTRDPPIYYHSTGSMNPIKLWAILKHGILSKNKADMLGLSIDSNGIGCNGSQYVSVATTFGGCVRVDEGAFHFMIDRTKLKNIRPNLQQHMPLERQISELIPKESIIGIRLEKEAFLDFESSKVMLGIGKHNSSRALIQLQSYIDFMRDDFNHSIPDDDIQAMQKIIKEMNNVSDKMRIELENNVNVILKKHLKSCFKIKLNKDTISPYDIVRYYDPNIPLYDYSGNIIESHKVQSPTHKIS